jgi:hypothetical protein
MILPTASYVTRICRLHSRAQRRGVRSRNGRRSLRDESGTYAAGGVRLGHRSALRALGKRVAHSQTTRPRQGR